MPPFGNHQSNNRVRQQSSMGIKIRRSSQWEKRYVLGLTVSPHKWHINYKEESKNFTVKKSTDTIETKWSPIDALESDRPRTQHLLSSISRGKKKFFFPNQSEGTPDKAKLKEILQSKCPVLLNNVKIMTDKDGETVPDEGE